MEKMVPNSLQTQVVIVVAAVTLHNYKIGSSEGLVLRSTVTTNWLLLIANDEDEEDEALTEFMPSHLANKWIRFESILLV